MKSGEFCMGPFESKKTGAVLQAIGKHGKVNLCENDGQEVYSRFQPCCCGRAFGWFSVSFAHPFQKIRFVTAVVDQHRSLDHFKNAKEFPPNLPFVLYAVRPQAVLNGRFVVSYAYSD